MIALCAQAHAAGDPSAADAVWEAGVAAVGWGATDGRRPRRARPAALLARPTPSWRIAQGLRHRRLIAADTVRPRVQADDRRQTKSKYTADRHDPGRLRGRDGHAPALHDRHGARAPAPSPPPRSCCRRSASRSGRSSRSTRHALAGRRRRSTTSRTTPTSPRSITIVAGIGEAGKTTVYVRKRNPKIDTDKRRRVQPVRRDLDALHAPRLPGALRRRPPSASSARATAASTTSGQASTAARRSARSTASTRACATAASRSARASRSTRSCERFSPRDPGEPLDGIGQYLYPSRPTIRKMPGDLDRCPSSSSPRPVPKLQPPPPRRPRATASRAARRRQGGRDHRRRLGRRAHVAVGRRALDDVPQGPEGDQLVLHAGLGDDVRLPHPGGDRRLPGDVLRPVADRRAYESMRYITNEVFLGEFVRGMHKWGSTVMVILVFLHMGAHVLLRRLQVPARAELDHRRRPADPDDDDVVHGLPAAVRPALLLGDDRRREHQRHRPARRPVPERLPARRAGVRRDHAVALLRDPHAARPGPDRRADRRAPLPRRQARHDRAAVAEGRGRRQSCVEERT